MPNNCLPKCSDPEIQQQCALTPDEFEGVGIAATFDPDQVYASETLGRGM